MFYTYNKQLRRILVQFARVFSSLEIAVSKSGTTTLKRVPILYGDMSYQVAQILAGGSENVAVPSPMISYWISNITMNSSRRANPSYIRNLNVTEQKFNPATEEYESTPGNSYDIKTHMPVPYDLSITVSVYTTNTGTKMEIFEQIATIFNPSLEIQHSENAFDWTSIFNIELTNIIWSNKSIGSLDGSEHDFLTLEFNVPIWISPPALVNKNSMIERIITNMKGVDKLSEDELDNILDVGNSNDGYKNYGDILSSSMDQHSNNKNYNDLDPSKISTTITAPGNFQIDVFYKNGQHYARLLNSRGGEDSELSWKDMFSQYGNIFDGAHNIILKQPGVSQDDTSLDISGIISEVPDKSDLCYLSIDLDSIPGIIPSGPIKKIIDPKKDIPGITLPPPNIGDRFLLISKDSSEDNIVPSISQWGGLSAKNNDIIQYNGSNWFVSFRPSVDVVFTLDLSTNTHLKFIKGEWVNTYIGTYLPMDWRIFKP